MPEPDRRDQFLIAMYEQLMNDINRHIVVVWQSIATLIAAIAAFSLVEKSIIPLDIAVSIVIITTIWLLAHVYDASYWYNRNLVMIANIERQFLKQTDLHDIHYYFGKHRPENKMISHLVIQKWLGVAVAALVLAFHIVTTLKLGTGESVELTFVNYLPWVLAFFGVVVWIKSSCKGRKRYEEFLENSPGADVDTSDVRYGIGHGFEDKSQRG